jgi:uncharacterized protein involved in exopolysaccharide biosynthesis
MNENQQNEIQLRSILSVVFKRKKQILIFFSVTIITVVVATFLITPQYEASTQILVTLGRGGLLFANMGDQAPQVFLDQENVINSEVEILKSAAIAEKAIKEMGGAAAIFPEISRGGKSKESNKKVQPSEQMNLAEPNEELNEALLKFKKSLGLQVLKKSNLINVSFRHPDPKLSAEILNKLTSIYVDHHAALRKTKKSYEFFQNQTELLKDKANTSGKELESFKRQHEISDFDGQKNILIRQHTELQFALNQTVTAEMEANNRSDELRKNMQSLPQNIPQGKQDDYNQLLLSNLQSRLVELELSEKNLSNKYTDENRNLMNVREEIRIVRNKLREHENKTYFKSTSGVNPVYQGLQQELIRLEAEKKALSGKREVLGKQIVKFEEKLTDLNRIELQYYQLKQQAESDRRNYDLYLAKLEESRISDAMDAEKISNVSVIQAASIPLKPVSPKPLLNIAMSIVFGLFGGLALAFLSEYMSDRIENADDVERLLELPVLTSIREFKKTG